MLFSHSNTLFCILLNASPDVNTSIVFLHVLWHSILLLLFFFISFVSLFRSIIWIFHVMSFIIWIFHVMSFCAIIWFCQSKVELAETEARLRRRSFYIISDPVLPGNESGGPHECGCCSAAGTVPRTSNLSWKPADPWLTCADAGPPAARQGALCRSPSLPARL